MSAETMQDLNTNTLIGFTEKRGNAWHYRAADQGAESNHYVGPVPVADVARRLFDWEPEVVPMTVTGASGKVYGANNPDRIVLGHPNTGEILGAHKASYQPHSFKGVLLDGLRDVIRDDVNVGSAGTLKGGRIAWVQIETDETWFAQGGIAFRPFLFAATSHDGSIATTFGTGNQLIVCDNTLSAAMMERGQLQFKIRHTTNSLNRIKDASEALQIIHEVGDDFTKSVEALLAEKVTDKVFNKWVDVFSGMNTKAKDAEPNRGLTLAQNKRDALIQLWNKDERVSPWKNTAWGVVQTANTFEHHLANARNQSRADRNALRMITTGKDSVAALDAGALKILADVRS
jgi:phage/plasmid-like protein (TIGR03299 family)